MSGRQKIVTFGAVLMTVLMVTSVFAGTAAAANIDTANTNISPDNIPVGADSSVDQNIVNGQIDLSSVDGSSSSNLRVRIDISNLVDQGVDIGQAGVDVDTSGDFTVSSSSVSVANEEIRITSSADDVDDDDTIDSITLTGLDTSNAQVGTELRYIVEVASAGSSGNLPGYGEFPGASDDSFASDRFSLSEINNVDQGTQHASIQAAVNNANPGDTIEVGPGTYREAVTIDTNGDGDDLTGLTLQSADPENPATISYTGSGSSDGAETVLIKADDVTVQDLTIERNAADSRSNPGAAASAVQIESANNAVVQNNVIEGTTLAAANNNRLDGVVVLAQGNGNTVENAQVTNNEISGFEIGTVVSAYGGDSSTAVTGATISDNTIEENEYGIAVKRHSTDYDVGGVSITGNDILDNTAGPANTGLIVPDSGSSLQDYSLANIDPSAAIDTIENNNFESHDRHVDVGASNSNIGTFLDAAFSNNDFDQYVTVEDADGTLQGAVYGDLGDVNENDATTASATTTVSAGDHSIGASDLDGNDGTFNVGDDDVSIVGADGAPTEDVTVSVESTFVQADSDVSGLTISGLTLDGDQTAVETNSFTLDELTVTDNQFVNVGDGTTVIAATDDTLNNVEIANNAFEAASDDGNTYTGIAVESIADPGASTSSDITADVTGNTFTGVSSQAIVVSGLDDSENDNNDVLLTVADNEIEQTGNTGESPTVDLSGLDTSYDAETVVDANTITGVDAGHVTGISVAGGSASTVDITENSITNLANSASTALDLSGLADTDNVVVENNEFAANGVHINYDDGSSSVLSGNDDATTLRDANAFGTLVFNTANEDDAFEDLNNNQIYGTIGGGLANSGSFVQVTPGTYEESDLATGSQNVVSTGSAAETIITGEVETNHFINIGNARVDGFSFQPTGDASVVDVQLTNTNAVLANATFAGVSADDPDRTAIQTSAGVTSPEVRSVDISNYGTGIYVSSGTARIEDSTVTDSTTGIDIDSDATVVRNTISGNTVGIASATSGTSTAIHFNDIVNNDDAGVEYGDSMVGSLRANWWGDANGPNVSTDTGADIVEFSDGDVTTEARPFLTSSYTELPQDQMVVITDATQPPADSAPTPGTSDEGARILVAILDDDTAESTNAGNTAFIVDGPDDLIEAHDGSPIGNNVGGSLTAADPLFVPGSGSGPGSFQNSIVPEDDTAGDYTIEVVNTNDEVNSGSATQTFSGAVADVDVTTDTTDLTADGETTANITLQLVDSEGNDVPRSLDADSISWSIDNNQAAGVERVNTDTTTDANGQATLTVTADTAGETFTVTGIDNSNNNADNVDVNTVEPTTANFTIDLVEGPTTITQNESFSATVNVTNEDGAPALSLKSLNSETRPINLLHPVIDGFDMAVTAASDGGLPHRVYSYTRIHTEGSL